MNTFLPFYRIRAVGSVIGRFFPASMAGGGSAGVSASEPVRRTIQKELERL